MLGWVLGSWLVADLAFLAAVAAVTHAGERRLR